MAQNGRLARAVYAYKPVYRAFPYIQIQSVQHRDTFKAFGEVFNPYQSNPPPSQLNQ
jgi:hypothetical protein